MPGFWSMIRILLGRYVQKGAGVIAELITKDESQIEENFPAEFFSEFIERFKEDGLDEVFLRVQTCIERISSQLAPCSSHQ